MCTPKDASILVLVIFETILVVDPAVIRHACVQRVGVGRLSMAAALSYQKPIVVESTEQASATVIWLHGIPVIDAPSELLARVN